MSPRWERDEGVDLVDELLWVVLAFLGGVVVQRSGYGPSWWLEQLGRVLEVLG